MPLPTPERAATAAQHAGAGHPRAASPLPGHPRPPPSSAESDGATSRLGQRPPSSLDEPELEKILEDLGALGLNEDAGSSEMMNG